MSQAVWTSETRRAPGGGAATLASVALHFDTKLRRAPQAKRDRATAQTGSTGPQ